MINDKQGEKVSGKVVIVRCLQKGGDIPTQKDKELTSAINEFSRGLLSRGEKTLYQKDNMVSTENGSYYALYTKDLIHTKEYDKHIENLNKVLKEKSISLPDN